MYGTRFVDRFVVVSLVTVSFATLTPPLAGQTMSAHVHHGEVQVSPSQSAALLEAARRATADIQTVDAARAAGYVPVFGNAPLQGEHFARPDLVMRDSFDANRPSVLMFAPVGGKPTIVGVAYTFYLPTDRMAPQGWTGPTDVWHSHEDIAKIPGKHIVMMHTWFIESPEGTLSHDNQWLPYYAASLTPQTPSDSSDATLSRRVGLALGLVTQPPSLIDLIQRQNNPSVAERTAAAKANILELATRLRSAQQAGDSSGFAALRRETAARGDSLVALYREGAGASTRLNAGLDTVLEMYLGRAVAPSR